MKTIAKSIDELLLRYGSKDQINFVEAPPTKTKTSAHDAVPDRNIVDLVNRIDRLETNFKRQNKKQSNWSKKKRELCSHCVFLNKELGSTLKTDHPSHLCGKKNVSVSLVESLGLADSNSDTPGENLSEYEGGIEKIVPNITPCFQISSEDPTYAQDQLLSSQAQYSSLDVNPNINGSNLTTISESNRDSNKTISESTIHYSCVKPNTVAD